jgi:hypothetical protein
LELTEKERLLLVEKKEEIRKLTEAIIQLTTDIESNKIEIKQKIQGILSLISTLASYTNTKLDLHSFVVMSEYTFHLMDLEPCLIKTTRLHLEIFCSVANTMTFNFTKKGLVITIPKIDMTIFKV